MKIMKAIIVVDHSTKTVYSSSNKYQVIKTVLEDKYYGGHDMLEYMITSPDALPESGLMGYANLDVHFVTIP